MAEEGRAQVPVFVHPAGAGLPFLSPVLGDKESTPRLPPQPRADLTPRRERFWLKAPLVLG